MACTSVSPQMTLLQRKFLIIFSSNKTFAATPHIVNIHQRRLDSQQQSPQKGCTDGHRSRRVVSELEHSLCPINVSWICASRPSLKAGGISSRSCAPNELKHGFSVAHPQLSGGHSLFCCWSASVWTCWLGGEGLGCGCGLPRRQLAARSHSAKAPLSECFLQE